ncbi:MAG: glycosyltransferase family 4 protein [Acidiferrobacterales bacterium]
MKDRKIRVLIVDQATAFGGSIIVAGRLVRALDKSKVESFVVSEMDTGILRNHFADSVNVDVIKHPLSYADHSRIAKRIRRLPMGGWLTRPVMYAVSLVSVVTNFVYSCRLAMYILRRKIDLVHLNNGVDNTEASMVAWLLRRRSIVHVHGLSRLGFMRRFLADRAYCFIAVSGHIRECLIREGIPNGKVVILPNPSEPMKIGPEIVQVVRDKYGLRASQRVFGIFGRIVRWKGHREFILAAALVLGQIPDAIAFIVGDHSDGDRHLSIELHDFVRRQGLQDRVIFTGYIENVTELYGIMDVVVHTSILAEPFGLVITEAMACGLPVVASNLGAPPEIIDDGKDGFIIDPKDTQALAGAIVTLLRDDKQRKRIGEEGQRKVKLKYDAARYARQMEQIYHQALEESNAGLFRN